MSINTLKELKEIDGMSSWKDRMEVIDYDDFVSEVMVGLKEGGSKMMIFSNHMGIPINESMEISKNFYIQSYVKIHQLLYELERDYVSHREELQKVKSNNKMLNEEGVS